MKHKKTKNQLKLTKNDKSDIKNDFAVFINSLANRAGSFSNLAKFIGVSNQQITKYSQARDIARPNVLYRIKKVFPDADINQFAPPNIDWNLIARIEELKEKESKSK